MPRLDNDGCGLARFRIFVELWNGQALKPSAASPTDEHDTRCQDNNESTNDTATLEKATWEDREAVGAMNMSGLWKRDEMKFLRFSEDIGGDGRQGRGGERNR